VRVASSLFDARTEFNANESTFKASSLVGKRRCSEAQPFAWWRRQPRSPWRLNLSKYIDMSTRCGPGTSRAPHSSSAKPGRKAC